MDVIFESSKCFWKSKCTLDICIVHHRTFEVLEVIAFDSNIAKESPRIFVDCNNLALMINGNDIEEHTKKLKEPFLRRKEVPDEAKLKIQARNEAKAELIMNRLQVEKYSMENRTLQMVIVETVCDMERGRPKLVCARPPGLQDYAWSHTSKITSKDVEQSLELLSGHLTGAKKDSMTAAQYQQTARSALTVRERWRVALVFGKVAKGRRLSATDSRIWGVICKNLREQDLEPEFADGSIGGSSKRDETDGGTVRLHSLAAQRRRRGSSLRGLQKGNLSPRQLSPREVVAHHVQSITPRSYSVAVSPRHEGYGHGFGMDGITHSLEHSLGSVPGVSLDTRNKHYRVAASVELDAGGSALRDEGGGEAIPHIPSFRNRPTSALSPRHCSSRDISPRNSIKGQFEQSGEASIDGAGINSRPQSASPYNGRSMRAHSPISRVPSQDAADAPPAMKRKLSRHSVPPPTACDLANKQLLATRMLKSIAAAGAAIRTSIRASFSNDKTKVFAEAAAAATAAAAASNADEQTVDFRVAHKKSPTPHSHSHSADSSSTAPSKGASVLNSNSRTSTTAESAAISSTAAVASAGTGPRPGPGSSTADAGQAGGFVPGGFLSVDVIRSMVRKVTFQ